MSVLLDTNILLGLAFPRDVNHRKAQIAMRNLTGERIIAAPILPELFYLMTDRMGYDAAVKFFRILQSSAFRIEPLITADMKRMSDIMAEYQDNAFDFVDTAIMALSERLKIETVYTLDQRDFAVFRPRHCTYLKLLP